MDFKLVKVRCDIKDKDSRLIEHSLLNDDLEYLTHCLIKKDGNWFWLVSDTVGNDLKFHTDDEKFYCPCCMEELFIKCAYSQERETHLCHYSNTENDCKFKAKFKSNSDKKYIYDREYAPESDIHMQIKNDLMALIELQEQLGFSVYLQKPIGYQIIGELSPQLVFNYKKVKIVKVEKEVQIIKKVENLSGFRADLNFYDEEGNVYFVEVTVTNGKSRSKYYPSWQKGQLPVYEIFCNGTLKIGKKDFSELGKKVMLTNLPTNGEMATEGLALIYDPIYHEGIEAKIQAEKRADDLLKEIHKKRLWGELNKKINRAMRTTDICKRKNTKTLKWHHFKRINGKEVFLPKHKFSINYLYEEFIFYIPKELGEELAKSIDIKPIYEIQNK